jgi:hypothetical protein
VNQILLKTARIFLAKAQSSQRKAKLLIILNQDLKLFLAFFVYGRAFARAGYVFARDDFGFEFLVPACPG